MSKENVAWGTLVAPAVDQVDQVITFTNSAAASSAVLKIYTGYRIRPVGAACHIRMTSAGSAATTSYEYISDGELAQRFTGSEAEIISVIGAGGSGDLRVTECRKL